MRVGSPTSEVVVFGVSENDLSMIEGVPNSVAVANADKAVAQAARWHIGASTDHAMTDALFDIAATGPDGVPAFMREG